VANTGCRDHVIPSRAYCTFQRPCRQLPSQPLLCSHALRVLPARRTILVRTCTAWDRSCPHLKLTRCRKKRAKALSGVVAALQSSQFSGESWQYVLLLPPLLAPYSSPIRIIGTPCAVSSAAARLRTCKHPRFNSSKNWVTFGSSWQLLSRHQGLACGNDISRSSGLAGCNAHSGVRQACAVSSQ